jgi:hypothetical protein
MAAIPQGAARPKADQGLSRIRYVRCRNFAAGLFDVEEAQGGAATFAYPTAF